jgi:hypothetical protein
MKAPIQTRKFSVSFGDSISFLSMALAYSMVSCRAALGWAGGTPAPAWFVEKKKAAMSYRGLF